MAFPLTRRVFRRRIACLALLACLLPLPVLGQAASATRVPPAPTAGKPAATWADEVINKEGYVTPPRELADAVLAPRHQVVSLSNPSPDKKWFLSLVSDGPVPMSTFSKPFHELGGVFVDFKANRARPLTVSNGTGIVATSAADGTKRTIAVPPNARVSNPTWSPDSSSVAYYVHGDEATHIWVTEVAANKPRQVTPRPVLATLVTTFEFTKDGKKIATVLVPEGRALPPVAPIKPLGPEVKVHDGQEKNRLRTFPSLMSTPFEFDLFEWHATGQLALVDTQGVSPAGQKTRAKNAAIPGVAKIGQPAMIRSLDVSPDGKHVLVTRLAKPFSYMVPVSNFASVQEVWDAEGRALAKVTERALNLGTQDGTPPDPADSAGTREAQQGRREIAWREDGQGLTLLEQELPSVGEVSQDVARGPAGGAARAGGGQRVGDRAAGRGRGGQTPQRKDRLYQWTAPFDEKSLKVIYENPTRMNNHRFSPDMQVVFFRETSGQDTTELAVYLAEPSQRHTLARFRSDDPASNPGTLVPLAGGGGRGSSGGAPTAGRGGAPGPGGGLVMVSADKGSVYYQGTLNDRNPDKVGPKTFIDRVAIRTGEKKRLYESENQGVYESVAMVVDPESGRFVVERQGPAQAPQFFAVDGSSRRQVTENKDLFPDLTSAPRRRVMVERADGIRFPVYVMLPPGYTPGTRLPALFWFYPREFADQAAIDRPDRAFNKNAFQNFGTRSMQFFVRLGYAVVVDTPGAIPIVGKEGQQNNNYVHDLRNSLAAVIDTLDREGLIDRGRLAIGGHSYGAFTTVNAMVHTPFFRAGIAGDGAYNRTLTPMTFQSERRDLWEAPQVYLGMSPFLYANNLTGALLMYHGLGDQNVGTDPTNSVRLFHALNGLGKTAALYLYPLEDHGPASKETLLDLWARWAAWLDKYVKNAGKTREAADVQ